MNEHGYEFKIEKGSPPPELLKRGGVGKRWPFFSMAIGEHITLPADMPDADKRRARSSAYVTGAKRGVKFTCRTMPDGSWRIWCIGPVSAKPD